MSIPNYRKGGNPSVQMSILIWMYRLLKMGSMQEEFPHKFNRKSNGNGAQVAPAAASASRNTKQGRRSVKLTPSQIAMAKRLNVPLEEYARYVKD